MLNEPELIKISVDLIEFPEWNPRDISAREFKKLRTEIKQDPVFCDVIVKRWENLTGHKATLYGK